MYSGRLWRPWKDTGTVSKPSSVLATTFVHLFWSFGLQVKKSLKAILIRPDQLI